MRKPPRPGRAGRAPHDFYFESPWFAPERNDALAGRKSGKGAGASDARNCYNHQSNVR